MAAVFSVFLLAFGLALLLLGALIFALYKLGNLKVTDIAVLNGPVLGLTVAAVVPPGLKPPTLIGKPITLYFTPAGGKPIIVASTVLATFDSAGVYSGPAPTPAALPPSPPAGTLLIQIATPSASVVSAFPSGASTYSGITSGARVRFG